MCKIKETPVLKAGIRIAYLFMLLIIVTSCRVNKGPAGYLNEVLVNLEKIESATYYEHLESWQPGDTARMSSFCRFVKEYNNPGDTTIGASFVSMDCEDTTQLEFGYDGKIRALIYHEHKGLVVDDFTVRPLPFRPLSAPFFNYTKNIIRYALTTQDSVILKLEEFDDHFYFKLIINEDEQVEFFGMAYHMPDNPYNYGETTSVYELWIGKHNNLPYKVRREMSTDISATTCSGAEFNKLSIADFNLYEYFPASYEIRKYGMSNSKVEAADLEGKKAPPWVLYDKDEQSLSLSDLKGEVLLIQFTGIGCGPCMASIPFLKELRGRYSTTDLGLIAIETWSRKPHSLRIYSEKNQLNYNLLNGTDDVIRDYQTGGGVPAFYILDEQRIIKKVIHGYSEETTGEEITSVIDQLLR